MAEILFISLIHLIQHPDYYDQKHVRVIGFASMKFEGKAIYVSKEDYDHGIRKNAIWLDVALTEHTMTMDKSYLLVEGIFDRSKLGNRSLYSGTLMNLNRLEIWHGGNR
jgi:hypothetical protein